MECIAADKKMVPLNKIVKAAIVDVHGDLGRLQEMYQHWGARGLKKFQKESLKLGKRRERLPVNRSLMSATLPVDFEEEFFVGYIDEQRSQRVALRINTNLINENSITDIECEDRCPKCNQDTSICNQLQVSETIEFITINDVVYDKTITKKLYPNGDYFLETITPILDVDTNTISYFTQKEFITSLDLKPCGCLETTEENMCAIRDCCPDIYCGYFSGCNRDCVRDPGTYVILEDRGIIQLSPDYKKDYVYIEFWSFIPKRAGQYLVPEVAFEALVNFIKFKAVENRSNVPLTERNWFWVRYTTERKNMDKLLARVSLSSILQASMRTPKLDVWVDAWRTCFRRAEETVAAAASTTCDVSPTNCASGGTSVVYIYRDIAYGKLQFKVGDSGAPMVAGQTELTINDPKIFDGSVNVVLDGSTLYQDMTGSIYYNVVYSASGVKITIFNLDIDNPSINYGVLDGQKYRITWSKTV